MTPYLDDGDITLYHGDSLAILRTLPAGIAQTCVTSPPYWGLRDYGTEPSVWGGDPNCEHDWTENRRRINNRHAHALREGLDTGDGVGGLGKNKNDGNPSDWDAVTHYCRCGAWLGHLGLEPTPEEYVDNMVALFREVRRVLRDDGTLWLNLGDSYASQGGHTQTEAEWEAEKAKGWFGDERGRYPTRATRSGRAANTAVAGLKPKDLVGIPWRVAFALQADGWYLRSDIIWSKPNPMPESVTDRPTKAHEYVFLFSKQPRYFYDADAIREDSIAREVVAEKAANGWRGSAANGDRNDGGAGNFNAPVAGRNRRSVWTIPTEPFPEAHFATYPQELVRPCILAGSKPDDLCLDPFVGSGTTCLVARKHGRRCIGIDLSAEYLNIAAKRTRQLSLLA